MIRALLLLLASTQVIAADIQLSWDGDLPFVVSASRIVDKNTVQIFSFNTQNNKEIVNVNGSICTQYKVCSESGCAEIPRKRIQNGIMVACK